MVGFDGGNISALVTMILPIFICVFHGITSLRFCRGLFKTVNVRDVACTCVMNAQGQLHRELVWLSQVASSIVNSGSGSIHVKTEQLIPNW